MMKKVILSLAVASLISCSDYSVKNKKVYYTTWNEGNGKYERVVEGADYSTFKELKNVFAKDKNNVFFGVNKVLNADPQTFEIIDEIFSKDKNHAFYNGEVIKNATGKNFKPIDQYYSTDGKDVFLGSDALQVCSAKNFKFVFKEEESYTSRWVTDGCSYYFETEKYLLMIIKMLKSTNIWQDWQMIMTGFM